ncbi:HlyD family type I secretion periplasmic adaptor subunit [Pelagerythrobacter marinus]|uniref:Membrane fusion protein (MFP) family protein n=1 Tax=Pelagerythrobacter marinus TaxID=538382 RepID=A0ABW9UUF3_9SPHN|nr:HlyD family type I secretion periplasmic adaptor subunit [Pelagerythrobacter marinus]MXO67423.1 HlyD family type I secretion periplasmic adaptor subunit [Pelagerythrobacter marinus]USA38513.1 HlyD family type I secretion periplasmic adaptor subunit [Pelagerythrobacter marinus]WPZ07462.1 HlyD family type I secretion periplasmic adaptor subunit [Pelagerythrobacter marinus]
MSALAATDDDWLFGEAGDPRLQLSNRLVWTLCSLFAAIVAWAWFATLDEVATGSGRVVPTMREQVIESLEGGILARLHVKQDDIVEAGQVLAQLDPTQASSTFEESAAKYRAALAASARLEAEVGRGALTFPAELDDFPDLKRAERRLYDTRRASLNESIRLIDQSIALIRREVAIGESLIEVGAASNVEVIRLRRQLSELELKKADLRSQYLVEARQQLAKANEEVEALAPIVRGRSDTLERLTLRSPVKGIVKSIQVSTVGGVVPPNGRLMEIIPLEDQLMIEARMSPRDIAFIHPGQRATVKVTAYDYSIYGGLDGEVATISPDTIRDEVNPEIHYYRVFIRTSANALVNDAGERFPIGPGMITTVDIHTGQKTVLQYLMKPINRAREALRER